MPELRVVIDERFNELLNKLVEKGLFTSKAELMRSATVYLLMNMGVLKEFLSEQGKADKAKGG